MTSKVATVIALLLGSLAGCNNSPPGGVTNTGEGFRIAAPTIPVMLKQGDTQTIKVTLNRDANFKQDVVLTLDVPKGLKVEMPKSSLLGKLTVKAADAPEVPLSISADKDVALGEHSIKVTGTPDKGNATSVEFKVNISKP